MSVKEIPCIPPPEAWHVLGQDPNAILIDVRSKVEFDYVGHPIGAVHVAWKEYPDWKENAAFVDQVQAALAANGGDTPSRPLLMLCRSGVRSLAAAQALATAGYTATYNVSEGFEGDKDDDRHRGNINGWRFHRLPWEQT